MQGNSTQDPDFRNFTANTSIDVSHVWKYNLNDLNNFSIIHIKQFHN